jgi:hypothetical protein
VSLDLFVDRFENGQSIGASTDEFERVFGPFEVERDETCSFRRLRFNDRGEADAYISGAGAFMFNHFGGEEFFERLFEFLAETGSVAYWPGADCAAAVASSMSLSQLPADMRRSLRPAVVHSHSELMQRILA